MSAPAPAFQPVRLDDATPERRNIDYWMLSGVVVALGAVFAGIAWTGIQLKFFVQPTGVLIVIGGTIGVTLITTPRHTLRRAVQGALALIWTGPESRDDLLEEIVMLARTIRPKGLFFLEPLIVHASEPFLRESLQLAMDACSRTDLQSMLETKARQIERQGETDARAFEIAGGFAPTIGVLGTVVGLMDVLKQFTNITSVAAGTGTAFVSTIYGLALANLILLPSAQRIRARVADQFETHEMIVEGTLCLFDGINHALVRDRLSFFLHSREKKS